MKKLPFLFVPVLVCLLSIDALPQRPTYPKAPTSMDSDAPAAPPPAISRRVNLQQLQKDADELARTAQTIPDDVSSVRRGMLPKDVVQKLKQIEKLSKRMRSELNP